MSLTEIKSLETSELFVLYAELLKELQRRQVVRSANNPVAGLAEFLLVRALGLGLAPNSTRGYDATDTHGMRYQIKARRIRKENPSRQMGFIRGLDKGKRPFDYLAGVLFDEHFSIYRACLIPVETIPNIATYRRRENAWRLLLRDKLWERDDVRDITSVLRETATRTLAAVLGGQGQSKKPSGPDRK